MYVCMYIYIYIYLATSRKPATMTQSAKPPSFPITIRHWV